MPVVELLTVAGCPGARALRPRLRRILDAHDIRATIRVVEVHSEREAEELRFLGSPTVRVDGVDVDPGAADRSGYGLGCRLYPRDDGVRDTPPERWIHDALHVRHR